MKAIKKTFRIGEYAIGGVVKVEVRPGFVKVACHDWHTGVQVRWYAETTREGLYEALYEVTSSYYADTVMDWIDGLDVFTAKPINGWAL